LRHVIRLLAYDTETSCILIIDGSDGLLVDVTLTVGIERKREGWIQERLSLIMVVGDLELVDVRSI
jgi:hypothetical protein